MHSIATTWILIYYKLTIRNVCFTNLIMTHCKKMNLRYVLRLIRKNIVNEIKHCHKHKRNTNDLF